MCPAGIMRSEYILKKYFNYLERRGKTFNIVVALICTALLGIVDYLTVEEVTLTLFYLMPISFVAWFAGITAGIALALLCTGTWIIANNLTALTFFNLWKVGTSLGFFIIIAVLLSKLRQMFNKEQNLSQTDHLTGVVNRRAFLQILTNEILRQSRNNQPLTLAYVDLDNFKVINDSYGHSRGDFILQLVADTFTQSLRKSDTIARLGGDEFTILLPDVDQQSAQSVIPKIKDNFQIITKQHQLEVTLSIGVLTCLHPPKTADEMITLADDLMYEVKKSGRNGIRYAVYKEQLSLDLR
jgi:diguanylate cyclase (GGDEF)-like protein